MKVGQLMKQGVRSCQPHDSLSTAAQIMWETDCGCVPVTDDQGRVVGIITDRDVCMAAYLQGAPLRVLQVWDAMSKEVFTTRPEDTVAQAEATMRERQVRRLPVLDADGHLVGILSLNDIAIEAGHGVDRKKKDPGLGEVGATLEAICRHRSSDLMAT